MRKIVLGMHISLDGFVGGPNGEMDWIQLPEGLFDFVGKLTDEADTALYGRVTWEMMEGYWPTAGDNPGASKHDKEHSAWYKAADKIVISKSMADSKAAKTTFIGTDIVSEISKLKQKEGRNIIIFGSPSVSHILTPNKLIDEYWLFVNPVLLGAGIPLFKNIKDRIALELAEAKTFKMVTALNYRLAGG